MVGCSRQFGVMALSGIQGCFKGLSDNFQRSFKRVPRIFQGGFLELSRGFPECLQLFNPGGWVVIIKLKANLSSNWTGLGLDWN